MEFLCIDPKPTGGYRRTIITDPINCPDTGFIAESSTSFQQTPTLFDLFSIPLATDLNQMFMYGLFIPLLAYMTAWGYGIVINWFNEPGQ